MAADICFETNWVEALKSIDSATLSNAVESFRLRPMNEGFAPFQIRCLFPELGQMVGYAVTAQAETMTEGTVERSPSLALYEAVMQSPKPAVVAIQEIGPRPDYATHCGEVMATILKRLGAVGLVSDSAVRDIPEVRAMRFHYFGRGTVASHAYFRVVRVGVPIHVQGLSIRPHDILHGDENGLIVVPREKLNDLPAEAEAIRVKERMLMEFVRGPEFTFEGLRKLLQAK